jgi:signal peptidase I
MRGRGGGRAAHFVALCYFLFSLVLLPTLSRGAGPGGAAGRRRVSLLAFNPGQRWSLLQRRLDVREQVAVGDRFVPVIGVREEWSAIRQRLFRTGVYPGVEYQVLAVEEREEGGKRNRVAMLQPSYPLVARLERKWPVSINLSDIPMGLAPEWYNVVTAASTAFASLTFLAVGWLASQAITLSVIPSRSMDPTLGVGDVILVEKVTRGRLGASKGRIVFFSPPASLADAVSNAGGKVEPRALFVKRIAATAGDQLSVSGDGEVVINGELVRTGADLPAAGRPLVRSIGNKQSVVPKRNLFVLGDNPQSSVDSRIWGFLPQENLIGFPLLRLLPLNKFGPVQ